MTRKVRIPSLRKHVGRFLFLLICLTSFLVLRPFLGGYVRVKLLMDVFITFLLVSGAYAVSQKRLTFIIALCLVTPTVLVQWSAYMLPQGFLTVVTRLFSLIFFAYVAVVILNYLFHEKKVTSDVIYGAICVYLLIGLAWGLGYGLLEVYHPFSFELGKIPRDKSRLIYFSYVTMTTVGYGDITPLSPPAQFLSVLEAMTGQLYLAIIIARLVGMHISQSITAPNKN